MNKLFTKIATACVGLAMAVGVGVAVGSNSKLAKVNAADEVIETPNLSANIEKVAFTLIPDKGSNSNAPTSGGRIYPNNTLTFNAKSGYVLTGLSVSGTVNANKKGTIPTGWSITDGSNSLASSSIDEKGALSGATLSDVEKSSLVFSCSGSAGNIDISSLTVSHQTSGGGVPDPVKGTLSITPVSNNQLETGASGTFAYTLSGGTHSTLTTAVWGSDNTDAITVDESTGEYLAIAPGNATITLLGEDGDFDDYSASYDIEVVEPAPKYTEDTTNKTITWDLSAESYDSASETAMQWSSPKVTIGAAKADAGTATNNYCPPSKTSTRFYKDSTLTFTPASGYQIISIVAQATSLNYANALSGSEWTNATATANATTFAVTITASGTGEVSAIIGGTSGLTSIVVYYGIPRTLTSISSVTATVTASNEDSEWTVADPVVMGRYSDSVADENITNECNVSVTTAYPTITSSGTMKVTLRAESKSSSSVYLENSNITATLTFVDLHSIQRIYSLSAGAELDFDGVYMGDVRDGIEVMNGAYGICVYYGNDTVPAHGYVAGTTKLHVTGTLEINKNLYRVAANGKNVEEQTNADRLSNIATPVIYQLNGGESTEDLTVANRKTHGIGYVKSITDTQSGGHKNLTFHIKGTGENDAITVFAANAFLSDSVVTTLEDSLANQTEITIEGFTSFYTNFQVQFTGIVAASQTYHAVDFAQELLDLTDSDCSNYDPINNSNPNNIDALAETWVTLQDSSHYLQLSKDDKDNLVDADAIEHENPSTNQEIIEAAMARYEMLVKKYGADKYGDSKLTDFIGRNVVPNNNALVMEFSATENSAFASTLVIIAIASVTAIGGYFLLRKKKEQ